MSRAQSRFENSEVKCGTFKDQWVLYYEGYCEVESGER